MPKIYQPDYLLDRFSRVYFVEITPPDFLEGLTVRREDRIYIGWDDEDEHWVEAEYQKLGGAYFPEKIARQISQLCPDEAYMTGNACLMNGNCCISSDDDKFILEYALDELDFFFNSFGDTFHDKDEFLVFFPGSRFAKYAEFYFQTFPNDWDLDDLWEQLNALDWPRYQNN